MNVDVLEMIIDVKMVNRCIKMALVHDIAESIVGDIAPADNIPKKEKQRLEMVRRLGK